MIELKMCVFLRSLSEFNNRSNNIPPWTLCNGATKMKQENVCTNCTYMHCFMQSNRIIDAEYVWTSILDLKSRCLSWRKQQLAGPIYSCETSWWYFNTSNTFPFMKFIIVNVSTAVNFCTFSYFNMIVCSILFKFFKIVQAEVNCITNSAYYILSQCKWITNWRKQRWWLSLYKKNLMTVPLQKKPDDCPFTIETCWLCLYKQTWCLPVPLIKKCRNTVDKHGPNINKDPKP
jgi:hypothetical protein